MPVSFFIPVVLTRYFSVDEFGQYKQIFILFALALPFVDFGVTQGLIYFLPREREKETEIISHYLLVQSVFGLIIGGGLYLFREYISMAMAGSEALAGYTGLLAILIIIWALSNNLEIFYTAKKMTVYSGVVIFLSDGVKGLFIIVAVLLGGNLTLVLQVFIVTGLLRLIWMVVYIARSCTIKEFAIHFSRVNRILRYSLPLGFAVSINSFIEYSHQLIVSSNLSVADFAFYSIGCFQVPIIGVMTMSVAQVVIVRIGELDAVHMQRELESLLAGTFRKLGLLFIPVFVLLMTTSTAFIETLYTAAYLESVMVFRVFICILPLSVFLVEYLPRACGDSFFNLKINIITLAANIVLVFVFLKIFGSAGAALGFLLSTLLRKLCVGWFLRRRFGIVIFQVVPVNRLLVMAGWALLAALPGLLLAWSWKMSPLATLVFQSGAFTPLCIFFYWNFGVLHEQEKRTLQDKLHGVLMKFLPIRENS